MGLIWKKGHKGILGQIQDIMNDTPSLWEYPFFKRIVSLLDSYDGEEFDVFELKTIAFEFETMKRLIGYGEPIVTDGIFIGFDKEANPSNLNMGIWLEFVPQAFKSIAQRAIQDLHAKFMFTYANEETRIAVIYHMLHFIRADMLEAEVLERSKLKNNYPW